MSRAPPPKRQKAESRSVLDFLTDYERDLYNVIKSKENMGIWTKHLKDESKVPSSLVPKCLKSLQTKNLIKEVSNVQSKGKKYYMASEFEPSVEITGGIWYKDGELNLEYIHEAREAFLRVLDKQKVVTLQKISSEVKKDRRFKEFTEQQTEQVLRDLVIDSRIMEVKSTGTGEFASVAVGVVCYKCKSKGGKRGEPKVGAMASIPCGVCPRISHCTPDGIISPATCEYFTKWLEF